MITKVKINNYRRFANFELSPRAGMNILVGGNEAGKSTLLEAISLAASGRINGRWAQEEVNPYWFNAQVVQKFFEDRASDIFAPLPEIDIEIYFGQKDTETQRLRGLYNSEGIDCPGLRLRVVPDDECESELEEYFRDNTIPHIIPTELYKVIWEDFSGQPRTRQPIGVGHSTIDSRTIRSTAGIDSRTRQMLRNFVTREESIKIALQHRQAKIGITDGVLQDVNKRIQDDGDTLGVGLQMDQSANSNWDTAVTPQIGNIPFALLGQGKQVHAKVTLAMSKNAQTNRFVLIEEPENHLSHTSLMELVDRIEQTSNGRQTFISTHSSYVLNRLGLERLHLLHNGKPTSITIGELTEDTVSYYQKQSGYDTLRLVLADKVVVVEGPSDEMIFNDAYKSVNGVEPRANGVDVIALGTRGKRALELSLALDRKVAVLRDNDGKEPQHWVQAAQEYLQPGVREMFVGNLENGPTLEPQFVNSNDESKLRRVLGVAEGDDLVAYMIGNKTDAAWRIVCSGERFDYPAYILDAVRFIDAD